jgi:hypothetical protein
MDQSRRRTAGSLLTASKRSVSIVLSVKGRGSLLVGDPYLQQKKKAPQNRLQNKG